MGSRNRAAVGFNRTSIRLKQVNAIKVTKALVGASMMYQTAAP
ncbi:MAG TPA: hypothetical protein V6D22_10735 [Candidatus Obscuribacterales bacterium]